MVPMKVTFWGVRGSFPVAAADSLRYGGNTPCVEVQAGDTTILIDAGTGIRDAGRTLAQRGVDDVALLVGHVHWDHIQGFPHLELLHRAGGSVAVHSIRRQHRTLEEIFRAQQDPAFFPVSLDDSSAQLSFVEHDEGEVIRIGEATIRFLRLNHPSVAIGFRIEYDDSAVAYICDADVYGDMLLADELPFCSEAEKQQRLSELGTNARDLCHRADLVVCDTFFLPEEYQPDWGHSRPDDALRLAEAAEAQSICLFHHRPGRDDAQLDAILSQCQASANGSFDVLAAVEGLEITV